MDFSYVAGAGKKTKLEDSRHSESVSNLQQCLYLMCKEEIGMLDSHFPKKYFYLLQ